LSALQSKAAGGNASAQEKLGKAYAKGNGTKFNFKEAAQWLGMAATNGNADAESELAELYQAGLVGADLTQSITVVLTAAMSGSNLQLSWVGGSKIELQTTSSLSSGTWTVVSGSLGASSASIPLNSGTAAFFRLVQVP
jgi:TPR repeat protein